MNHQAHSIRLALAELRALGYRRIGLVMRRHEDERTGRNWLSSVLLAQHDAVGTALSSPLLFAEKIEHWALRAWLGRARGMRKRPIRMTGPRANGDRSWKFTIY